MGLGWVFGCHLTCFSNIWLEVWNVQICSCSEYSHLRFGIRASIAQLSIPTSDQCGTRVSQDCRELCGLWRGFNGNLRELNELHTCSFAAVTDWCGHGSRDRWGHSRRVSLTFGAVEVLYLGHSSLCRQEQEDGFRFSCVSAGLALTDPPALEGRIRKLRAKAPGTKSTWQAAKCSSPFPWLLCSIPAAGRVRQQQLYSQCQYLSAWLFLRHGRGRLCGFICVHFWDENIFAILDKADTKKIKIKSKYLLLILFLKNIWKVSIVAAGLKFSWHISSFARIADSCSGFTTKYSWTWYMEGNEKQ